MNAGRQMNPDPQRPWFSWKRFLCVAVTVAALVVIFRHIDRRGFVAALAGMRPGWFGLTVGLFGGALLLSAWRWHLALRATGSALRPAVSVRFCVIGHYLSIILFGGVAADIAKSSLYARWLRFGFPEVFAASPLDRLMGFAGLLLFGGGAAVLAAFTGGLDQGAVLNLQWSKGWVIAGGLLGLLFLAALIWWRPRGENAAVRLFHSIRAGAVRIVRDPRLALTGVGCGFLAQAALAGVLAFNLQAVSSVPLPWDNLFWTLPLISLVSSLPVTVAGLGVREGTAIVLLGFYGVPAADAVAASLLSLAAGLVWAGVGAAIFWREPKNWAGPGGKGAGGGGISAEAPASAADRPVAEGLE